MAAATAVINLDAAVLVMTPVVLAVAARRGFSHDTFSISTIHLANSASLLMPVSNLTNLMVFHESNLAFGRFTVLMALPWLGAILVEWLLVPRLSHGTEVKAPPELAGEAPGVRTWPAVLLALTLAGLMASGPLGAEPLAIVWVSALVFAISELARRQARTLELLRATRPLFLLGLLALGGLAWLLGNLGLTDLLADLVPSGHGFGSLLLVAAGAALLSNLVNNIPATLLLLPAVAPAGEGALLAMLIGVGIGPNLAYPGSIANLLWRREMISGGAAIPWTEFTRIGLVTVPAGILVATTLLWAVLRI
jgi:arsenical pump membrane protein